MTEQEQKERYFKLEISIFKENPSNERMKNWPWDAIKEFCIELLVKERLKDYNRNILMTLEFKESLKNAIREEYFHD